MQDFDEHLISYLINLLSVLPKYIIFKFNVGRFSFSYKLKQSLERRNKIIKNKTVVVAGITFWIVIIKAESLVFIFRSSNDYNRK